MYVFYLLVANLRLFDSLTFLRMGPVGAKMAFCTLNSASGTNRALVRATWQVQQKTYRMNTYAISLDISRID